MKTVLAALVTLSLFAPLATADHALTPPAPPTELTAAETSQGVRLNWSEPAAPPEWDGFNVYRSEGGPFTKIASTTDPTFLDPEGWFDTVPGEDSTYYVTAFNHHGESLPSNLAGDWPRCWDIIGTPGPLGLPVGVAISCYYPPPPLPICAGAAMVTEHLPQGTILTRDPVC